MGSRLDEHDARIRSMAAADWTLERMGAELGVHLGTVRQYCLRHGIPYNRKRGWRPGSRTGSDHPAWKGGRSIAAGYARVRCPTHPQADSRGYVAEHRLVMERVLGRPLTPTEVVHHRDGNALNNDPANLELFASNAAHMRSQHPGGWTWSDEARARLSKATKGKPKPPHTEEAKRKMADAARGRTHSEATRAKLSAARRANPRPISPEQREAMTAGRKASGYRHSEETKRKIAEAARKRFANRAVASQGLPTRGESGDDG
jgi:hypothetical protein